MPLMEWPVNLHELSKGFWVTVSVIFVAFFSLIIIFPPKDDGNRSFNKIYTVTNITKNKCNSVQPCTWEISYESAGEKLSSTVSEMDFVVGDKVYERLVCVRITGPDAGKEYDPRVEVERSSKTHSFFGFGRPRGGWCEMRFKGKYSSDIPD